MMKPDIAPARIEYLRVENYRALRKVELKNLTPLTVLLGPNGSGKSTVFDVFSFLSECFQYGLGYAWDQRGHMAQLRSRGAEGPVVIELKYRERPDMPLVTYHLAIDEDAKGPSVVEEWLQWRRGSYGKPFRFLEYHEGRGYIINDKMPDEADWRVKIIPLRSPDLIAVNTLGQFADHPRVAALREFITDWYISYLTLDDARGPPEAGPQARLSQSGDNLANVVQHLQERQDKQLENVFQILRRRIPHFESAQADSTPDGRLLLQIKDAPFEQPVFARFASDGTLKMLAYLTVLHNPDPPQFVGIEEPENFLHPRLLPELAEECRTASARTQLLVTTHSPFFLNGLHPEEVYVLYRDEQGYTQAVQALDIQGIPEQIQAGAALGHLWAEGYFGLGDPLVNAGAPASGRAAR